MFSNIGEKIKVVAAVFCWIDIIASILFGLSLVVGAVKSGEIMMIAVGIIVAVVGSLLSWIISFGLYGFGQLIENTDIIVDYIEEEETGIKL